MDKSLPTLLFFWFLSVSFAPAGHGASSSVQLGSDEAAEKEGYEDIKATERFDYEEEDTVSKNMNMDKVKQRLLELSYLNEKEAEETTDIFRGQLTIASLFSPQQKEGLYDGFYRLIGVADTNNTGKFTLTGGYFLPHQRGEVLFGYRLLSAKVRERIQGQGDYQEQGVENAFSLRYNKHLPALFGTLQGDLFYSRLSGISESERVESDTANVESFTLRTGSGDVDTWHTTLGYGIGAEGWENPAVQGIRLDLGGGYEEVYYREFDVVPETTEKGFLGYVNLSILTGLGTLKLKYRDGQSADVGSVEWQLGNLRFFWRDYGYDSSADKSVVGLGISGEFRELLDFPNYIKGFFRKPQRLFRKDPNGYDDVRLIETSFLEEESQFITKPRTYGVVKDVKFRERPQPPKPVKQAEGPEIDEVEETPAATETAEPESFDDSVDQPQDDQPAQDPEVTPGPNDVVQDPGGDTQDQTPPLLGEPVFVFPVQDPPILFFDSVLVAPTDSDQPTIN